MDQNENKTNENKANEKQEEKVITVNNDKIEFTLTYGGIAKISAIVIACVIAKSLFKRIEIGRDYRY